MILFRSSFVFYFGFDRTKDPRFRIRRAENFRHQVMDWFNFLFEATILLSLF